MDKKILKNAVSYGLKAGIIVGVMSMITYGVSATVIKKENEFLKELADRPMDAGEK